MSREPHYPRYDVMLEKDHWDDHTQEIVSSRLKREKEFQFLSFEEVELLKRVCSRLAGDSRDDIIQYVVCHIDETLASSVGEGQRKPGVPKAQVLIREGLKALEQTAKTKYLFGFIELDKLRQTQLLSDLSQSNITSAPEWAAIPQKEFFKKLLTLTNESYYSHPTVWSEIGYGGPAYPRGYIRTQLGQLDPWEAQLEKK